MRDIREFGRGIGSSPHATSKQLIEGLVAEARRVAQQWPTVEERRRFKAEMAGAVRQETCDPNSAYVQFLARLATRL